jgi:hypothetical protein
MFRRTVVAKLSYAFSWRQRSPVNFSIQQSVSLAGTGEMIMARVKHTSSLLTALAGELEAKSGFPPKKLRMSDGMLTLGQGK